MNVPYTNEELNRALDFINERLVLQRASTSNLNNALYKAALAILLLSRKYKINPKYFKFSLYKDFKKEVDKIIANLAKQIVDDTISLATFEVEDDEEDIILPIFKESINDNTFKEKIDDYAERFRNEMEVISASSLLLNKTPQNAANELKTLLPIIYGSSFMKIAKIEGIASFEDLKTNYGVGKYATSYNNLNRLVTDTIARSRQKLFINRENKNGANAWYVQRGSSYPCSLCDSNVGIHYKSFDLPPYHPNCVCMAIPLNTN